MPRTVDTRHVHPDLAARMRGITLTISMLEGTRDQNILIALSDGASVNQIALAASVSDNYIARLATRNGYTRTGGNTIHTRWVPPTTTGDQ